ncbi:MAG: DUF4085 family protein [Peptostreptococcaceae bacterium]
MRFFTKEWYNNMQKTDLHTMLKPKLKANKYSEKYYQNLYKKELKKFLKEEKEILEITDEEESSWDEISVRDENGNLVNVNEIMSPEEVEELRQSILEKEKQAQENFQIEEYDEEKLIKQFEENHLENIEMLKTNLPEEILNDVADIRVLALDKASRSIIKRIEKYCLENEEKINHVMDEYCKHFEKIENDIAQKIIENYELHDCQILKIYKEGNDIIFDLDSSGGFRDISKIIYRDGEVLENNLDEESYWLYDEIYRLDNGYEFHIGGCTSDNSKYDYITIKARDVDFEMI